MSERASRALAAVITVLSCTAAPGAGANDQVVGVVVSMASGRLVVRTAEGPTTAIHLSSQTRYVREGRAAGASDVKPGQRVAVEVLNKDGRVEAVEVVLGVMDAAAVKAPSGGHEDHAPAAPPAHAGHGTPPAAQQPEPPATGHEGHPSAPPAAVPGQPSAQGPHAGHMPSASPAAGAAPAAAGHAGMTGEADSSRHLFQSDMTRMTGMSPEDPMAGMEMRGWEWMTMGVVRAQYNRQGGPSGKEAFESTNWSMAMAQRSLGSGLLTLMVMNSLEPASLRAEGTPHLFQTGETFEGRPLVDRQHPHDFFMNLSATYRRPVGEHGAAWIQVAPVGEPALGPTAFMHRASAGENVASPLGHHWQDSTHITSNVVTVGGGWRRVMLEASAFHGREPDEERWDLDGGGLDSMSARLKVRLSDAWSGQLSYGFLNEPEALEEGDTRRTTVAFSYGDAGDRPFAATLLWGRNDEAHGVSDSFLLESAYQATPRDHVFARMELVEKDAELLEHKGLLVEHEEGGDESASIGALTVGYLRDLPLFEKVRVGLGADLTAYKFPATLTEAYGSSPVSLHVFARLRWGRPHGQGHGGMQH